jgi:hypothetical protein
MCIFFNETSYTFVGEVSANNGTYKDRGPGKDIRRAEVGQNFIQ